MTQKNSTLVRRLCGAMLALGAATLAAGQAPVPERAKTVEDVLPLVNRYCGACHAVPSPDVQPRHAWPGLIRIMVEIAQTRNGRAGLSEAQMNDIIAFYYGSSPAELATLPYPEVESTTRRFEPRPVGATSALPFVAHVGAGGLKNPRDVEFLVSDGEARQLKLLTGPGKKKGGRWTETPLADIDIPVHTQVVDVDADGDRDVLVADLGQFPPLESKAGKLVLVRQTAPGKYRKEILVEGLGRVSDARAADLDGDGDLDIAVAVFGGGDVGEVFWLRNDGKPGGPPNYQKQPPLFDISGAINIEPADLNGDGRMDLVSLIAQEHELLLAFVNLGEGRFERHVIGRAPHPMYGSTSSTLVDLDRDGDLDIIMTNGDAFDAQTDPKPYHGVQWFENQGQFKFAFHEIGRFYGAATAQAADMDGDGDLDVVAGSWVSYWTDPRRYAIVWFENDGRQRFTPHGVATRPAGIASLHLADVNGDGAPDIVAGAVRMDLLLGKFGSSYRASRHFPPAEPGATLPRVVVIENRAVRAAK